MTSLVVTTPDGQRQRHRLGEASLRIGRSNRNDLVIDDPTVSRVHAEVVRQSGGYSIVDLGARSGTFLNGVLVSGSAPLRAGDHLLLGRTSIVVDGDVATPVDITPASIPTGPPTTLLGPREVGVPVVTTPFPTAGAARSVRPEEVPLDFIDARPTVPLPGREPDAAGSLMDIVREADRLMLFHRPLEEIFESIMNLAGHTIGYERAVLMLLEDGVLVPRVVRTPRSEQGAPIAISGAIVERVLHRLESVLTSDASRDARFGGSRTLVDAHVRSVMCVPVRDELKVLGLLYLDSREAAGMFSEQDLRVLAHLASVAAVKIEQARLFTEVLKARMLESEILQAAAIQEHLLPADPPLIPGYDVFGRSLPCRSVGGDSLDYIELPEGRHVLTLGDVAGKGLPAALLMCCVHATLRAVAAGGLSVKETVGRLNRLLHARFPPSRYTTCFFSVLDPVRHELTYVNAGQETPYLLRRTAEPIPLPPAGLPLGLFEDSEYEAGRITLDPGDVLLCYSDGVTEGASARDEMFGSGRLLAAAAGTAGAPAAAIASAITDSLERHLAGRPHEDDVTLLVVRRSE